MRFMISMDTRMKIIAHIHTDFPDKFGIPRQSGLVEGLTGEITFEPEYRNPEIIRGIEQFSHIWLLWKFSESKKEHWSATGSKPGRGLEVKVRLGVFATRLLSELMISGFPACVCFVWNRRRKDRSFMWREQI